MLPGSGNYQWAQIGNYEVYQGVRKTAIQYAWSSTQVHQINLSPQTLGSFVYQTVLWDPSSHRFTFQIASSTVYSVVISQWNPAGAQISSEINTLSTQMMGATGNHQNFWDSHIYYSGAWHNYAGGVTGYNTTYFGLSGSAVNMDTWDLACSA